MYAGHRAAVLQMLVLGDNLLSLGKDRQLLVWKIGQYDAPEVSSSMQVQKQRGGQQQQLAGTAGMVTLQPARHLMAGRRRVSMSSCPSRSTMQQGKPC